MKLFLASHAADTLDLIHPLLHKSPKNVKVAFIPTASDIYPVDNRPWFDEDRSKLLAMGFRVTDYDIKHKKSHILLQDLSLYDAIFVSGGNVFYLLQQMQKSGFDKVINKLLSKGKIYIGSSAGSVILSRSVEHEVLFDDPSYAPGLASFDSLGIIPHLIHPHTGKEKYKVKESLQRQKWGDKLLYLRDDQALIIDNNKEKILSINTNIK